MVRVGVIGAGWFASRRHLPEFVAHPEVELVALCRRSPAPLATMAAHFNVPQQYTDPAQMLAEAELDAVLICTPHDVHHEQAAAALKAGCHVLLEKPMTITSADALDLVDRAEAVDRVLEVAYNPPFWKHSCAVRELIAAGELGEIEAVDIRWTGNIQGVFGREELPENIPGVVRPTMFRGDVERNGGGHLIDGGSHQICEAIWVTGLELKDLAASMDSVPDDIRFQVSLTYVNGAYGNICSIGDTGLAERRNQMTYYGSSATALVDGLKPEITVLRPGRPAQVIDAAAMPDPPQPVFSFIDAIQGRTAPRCPGRDCVRYVRAVEAAYEAAATGQRVRLN